MPPIEDIIAILIVIFFGIGLHEYAHAKFADNAGDPTPRLYGRVTLNLFKHFDPIGSIMIVLTTLSGFGIGWGRPVPMDPRQMKNPRWDHFMAVLAGPMTNLFQAGAYAVVLRVMMLTGSINGLSGFFPMLLVYGVLINLGLCFFNLFPLGPLDGMWLVGTFLPEKSRLAWTRWNLTAGQFVFIALIILGQAVPGFGLISHFIAPPTRALFRLLTGVPF